jgi:hypothetical protein
MVLISVESSFTAVNLVEADERPHSHIEACKKPTAFWPLLFGFRNKADFRLDADPRSGENAVPNLILSQRFPHKAFVTPGTRIDELESRNKAVS